MDMNTDRHPGSHVGGRVEISTDITEPVVHDLTERRPCDGIHDHVPSERAHLAGGTTMGTLAGSIAHQINHPLFGIVTNAGLLLRMLAQDPPDVEGARETARRTIRDAHRVSDVLTRLRTLFPR